MDQHTNKLKAGHLKVLFLLERFAWSNDPKKKKKRDQNLSSRVQKKDRVPLFLHVRSKYNVHISDRTAWKTVSGAPRNDNNHILRFVSKPLDMYNASSLGNIS